MCQKKIDAYGPRRSPTNKLDAYDAKVKVLIKSAKAVIIEPSLVKYDERLFRHMSFELVHTPFQAKKKAAIMIKILYHWREINNKGG